MRTQLRILGGIGLAAAWLATSAVAHAQLGTGGGGGGSSSGGGGSGGGGGGSGRGGGGQGASGQLGSGSTQPTSITGESLLGSFNNAGSGTRGGGNSAVSTSNLFSTTYVNPYQQGLMISNGQTFTQVSNAGFGQPVYGTITTGSGSRSSFGSTGANTGAGRSGSGSSFGGTSTGGSTMFGSTGSTGFGGGSSGLGGGSASLRSGGTGQTFAGGSLGPAIGRTGPVIGSALAFSPQVRIEANHRTDLQSIVGRSTTTLRTPAGVAVSMDSGAVVLRGTVATPDERRLVENMLRLHPGVHEVRNELEVRGGNP
jgi:hypothetical protein